MMKIDHKPKRHQQIYKSGDHELVIIGPHSYTNSGLNLDWWGGPSQLRIGNYCSVAADVKFFLSHGHRTDWITSYPFSGSDEFWKAGRTIDETRVSKGSIVVGSDVWIGNGVHILSGVSIGHGAVVATGSVVTRDVPPFAFVAGNPARIVRYRFEENQIVALLGLRWWDWPEDKVREHLPSLCSSDIAAACRVAMADDSLRPYVGDLGPMLQILQEQNG